MRVSICVKNSIHSVEAQAPSGHQPSKPRPKETHRLAPSSSPPGGCSGGGPSSAVIGRQGAVRYLFPHSSPSKLSFAFPFHSIALSLSMLLGTRFFFWGGLRLFASIWLPFWREKRATLCTRTKRVVHSSGTKPKAHTAFRANKTLLEVDQTKKASNTTSAALFLAIDQTDGKLLFP